MYYFYNLPILLMAYSYILSNNSREIFSLINSNHSINNNSK